MLCSRIPSRLRSSAIAILSLFLVLSKTPTLAQDLAPSAEQVRSSTYPVSAPLPSGWKSFGGDPKTPEEVLFLQSPPGEGSLDATLSLSAFPAPPNWGDALRRQNYHLVVELGAKILADEAMALRGARGHKWVYRGETAAGAPKLYYRLYLEMPATVGTRRLLVLHGVADVEHSDEATKVFGNIARGLSWGL